MRLEVALLGQGWLFVLNDFGAGADKQQETGGAPAAYNIDLVSNSNFH
jgi:hypothetical protein